MGFSKLKFDRIPSLDCLTTRVVGREPDDASLLKQVEVFVPEELLALARRRVTHQHHAQVRHETHQSKQRLDTCLQLLRHREKRCPVYAAPSQSSPVNARDCMEENKASISLRWLDCVSNTRRTKRTRRTKSSCRSIGGNGTSVWAICLPLSVG